MTVSGDNGAVSFGEASSDVAFSAVSFGVADFVVSSPFAASGAGGTSTTSASFSRGKGTPSSFIPSSKRAVYVAEGDLAVEDSFTTAVGSAVTAAFSGPNLDFAFLVVLLYVFKRGGPPLGRRLKPP